MLILNFRWSASLCGDLQRQLLFPVNYVRNLNISSRKTCSLSIKLFQDGSLDGNIVVVLHCILTLVKVKVLKVVLKGRHELGILLKK